LVYPRSHSLLCLVWISYTISFLYIRKFFSIEFLFIQRIIRRITNLSHFIPVSLQAFLSSEFLPGLETVKESYERKQIEHPEKCRQAQLSNLALLLVFYVFDKTAVLIPCNAMINIQQY
jgi:hypothetical protein